MNKRTARRDRVSENAFTIVLVFLIVALVLMGGIYKPADQSAANLPRAA